jgi:predicted nucleic acid-binding protein
MESEDLLVLTEAVADFNALRIERHQMTDLLGHVLELRDNFTVYDAAYVVLARALEVPLITSDDKLREARRLGVDVRVLRASSGSPASD